MAKQGGLGCALYLAGNDIGGDTQQFTVHGGPAALDVTDITQSGVARLGGERDAAIDWVSYMDNTGSHPVLSALPTTDVIATVFVNPVGVGSPALSQNAKQVNYDPTRGQDGSLTFAINGSSNGFGQEWGIQLTAGKRTDTGATAGSPFDNGAGFAFGAQGYLQVFSFSGTDVTVAIQHATSSGGSYSNLIAFSQITGGAPLAQRVATANNATVNEFLKVTTTTSGGFSSLVFAVQISVNPIAGVVF